MGIHMEPITSNIGILAGKDPVALDTACLNLVQKNSGEKLFENRSFARKYTAYL